MGVHWRKNPVMLKWAWHTAIACIILLPFDLASTFVLNVILIDKGKKLTR